MDRKDFLKNLAIVSALPLGLSRLPTISLSNDGKSKNRVRPGDPGWPSITEWNNLKQRVDGRLNKLTSPLKACRTTPKGEQCNQLFKHLKSPYYIYNDPSLTQSSGWLDAWEMTTSAYAVEVEETNDVVEAVNFAREHHLRLVVKGGAHSYQGRSNAPDSLLVWMRPMDNIKMHDSFIPKGGKQKKEPATAVTIGAGAIWMDAYKKVTVEEGRYVQGGGCLTVGVAGLVQSGGFGSFSKKYGLAAAELLEAEVVTADGNVRIANEYQNSDLFWALKGGGGGSFGVVTKLTLRTHKLPETFGVADTTIKAKSDDAYHKLIYRIIQFYHKNLFNPHWGEQIIFKTGNMLEISMMFQDLNQIQANKIWRPFKKWIVDRPYDYEFYAPFTIGGIPARRLWDAKFLKKHAPQAIIMDNQPNAPEGDFIFSGNEEEAGEFWNGYHSTWLPSSLLQEEQRHNLADALFAASRYWETALHFNKGLAGASPAVRKKAKNTAMNPVVTNAFALATIAGNKPPAFSGIKDHEPDVIDGRINANIMQKAIDELLKIVPERGSYVAESNYFEEDWQQVFWGSNYQRLARIKKKYDPNGLFYIHHGVGSERWTDDGFIRVQNS